MTIEEMKNELAKCNEALNAGIPAKYRKIVKERAEKLEFAIWKAEKPKQFENHRQALQGYVENTHYFAN